MAVKLVLLKSGETLISEAKELVSDEKQARPHAYLLENPHTVRTRERLQILTLISLHTC